MRPSIIGARCTVLALVLLGCAPSLPDSTAPEREGSGAASAHETSPARPAALAPYAPGRWRRVGAELSRVVLWPSHILIRYAGVRSAEDVSFSVADFHSVLPAPTRSREEALELAQDLRRRAQAAPQLFGELAREHSEDIVRSEQGGSFGGIPAAQLDTWPEVLDALFAIAPGEISEVVESWYGFHIFTRRGPPPPQTVTGRRIVIGHADARWLGALDAAAPPSRSRGEAMRLAEVVCEEAMAHPDSFPALVERYSELRDRVLGGDLGTWQNTEPSSFPREVEVLSRLEVGAVSRPFDSVFGVQIVQRVPNRERPEYAMQGVRMYFQPDAPTMSPVSRASVLRTARSLTSRLLESPSLPVELPKQEGLIAFSGQWAEGRGSPELMAALAAIEIGQVVPEPVRSAAQYFVGRRVQPVARPSEPPLFELPNLPAGG